MGAVVYWFSFSPSFSRILSPFSVDRFLLREVLKWIYFVGFFY